MIIHKPSFVVDDATGATFWPTNAGACFNATNARFRVAGVDLAALYASADNRFKLVIKDSALKKAEGFIDVADSAEALGSELHDDANAASDPNENEADATTGWTGVNLNTHTDSGETINEGVAFAAGDVTLTVTDGTQFTANQLIKIETELLTITSIDGNNLTVARGVYDTTDAEHADLTAIYYDNLFDSVTVAGDTGSYSFVLNANGVPTNGVRIYKDIGTDWSLVAGKFYKLTFDSRHIGAGGSWQGKFAANSTLQLEITAIDTKGFGDTSFASVSYYFIYNANYRYFGFQEYIGSNDGGIYVDNLSCTEVTNVGADGVLIMSTKGGSTQSWALQEAGIDLNDIDRFEVQRATRHHSL